MSVPLLRPRSAGHRVPPMRRDRRCSAAERYAPAGFKIGDTASQMRGDMVRRPKRAGFNLEVVNEARKNPSFLRVCHIPFYVERMWRKKGCAT